MRPSRRPADRAFESAERQTTSANPHAAHHILLYRKTGKPGSRTRNYEDHCTPGKVPNGVRWKNRCVANRVRRSPDSSFFGAGEGIRTPDPLITNQMLYRLSYASNSGDSRAFAQTNPSDPFRMSGTILKGITAGTTGASNPPSKRLLPKSV
jgi:hypothetical protein